MSAPGQQSLSNFYESVRFQDPATAETMRDDVIMVSMYALAGDKSPAQEAANRLRRRAFTLPPIQSRVLENTLSELGF